MQIKKQCWAKSWLQIIWLTRLHPGFHRHQNIRNDLSPPISFSQKNCQNICRMKMFRATSRQDLGFHVYTNSVFPSWNLPTHLKFLGRSARVCIFSLKSYGFLYNSFIVFSVSYLYFAFPRSHWFHYSLCGGSTKVCFSPVLPFDDDGRLL